MLAGDLLDFVWPKFDDLPAGMRKLDAMNALFETLVAYYAFKNRGCYWLVPDYIT